MKTKFNFKTKKMFNFNIFNSNPLLNKRFVFKGGAEKPQLSEDPLAGLDLNQNVPAKKKGQEQVKKTKETAKQALQRAKNTVSSLGLDLDDLSNEEADKPKTKEKMKPAELKEAMSKAAEGGEKVGDGMSKLSDWSEDQVTEKYAEGKKLNTKQKAKIMAAFKKGFIEGKILKMRMEIVDRIKDTKDISGSRKVSDLIKNQDTVDTLQYLTDDQKNSLATYAAQVAKQEKDKIYTS